MSDPKQKKLLWLDLEMTGLDEKTHSIIEIACVVTDLDWNTLDTYHEIVYQSESALKLMDDWCTKTHKASGLTDKIPHGKKSDVVEAELIALIAKNFAADEKVVIAGNSISNDRRFIDAQLKKFAEKLHYRMIDVSSFKEIFRDKYGVHFKKKNQHRAVDDIYESINELKTYLSYVKLPE